MTTLFISDLHLDPSRPATIQLFLDFLRDEAAHAEALYILGDLFEVWLGDDLIDPAYQPVLQAMKRLSEHGVALYVLHGNRDFLLGAGFEALSGARLIEEGHVVDLAGEPVLLLHGDTLCTDDLPYQKLRQMLRDPDWIAAFLAKSPEERIAFARQVREQSQKETGEKSESIMDVNPTAVSACLQQAGVLHLIHGHTHRPGVHPVLVDGEAGERLVLADWSETRGSVIRCKGADCRLGYYPQ